jgi:hypothetical protein
MREAEGAEGALSTCAKVNFVGDATSHIANLPPTTHSTAIFTHPKKQYFQNQSREGG